MKKGQIILGAAAFIVTAASALAFKAHSKSSGNRIFGLTNVNNPNSCTASTCFTNSLGGNPGVCHTINAGLKVVHTDQGSGVTFWTGKTNQGNQCTGVYHGNWTTNS
jgi:hypothetical protein